MYRQNYERKSVDRNVQSEADSQFVETSTVTIVGPARSGKTGLSFDLLRSYDLSNGEDNFVVVMDPGELKYVKFSLKPVIILKLLNGTDFDKVEAYKWYRQFNRLHAAVLGKKAAVITIVETETFKKWKTNMQAHRLLDHVVEMPGTHTTEVEKNENGIVDCGSQTEETNFGNEQHHVSQNAVSSAALRSVSSIQEYTTQLKKIKVRFGKCCELPSGEFLVTDSTARYSSRLVKLDRNYKAVSSCDLPEESCGLCNIGNNEAVVSMDERKLQFVNTEHLTLTKTVDTDHACNGIACHGNKLYVIDNDTVHVYSTEGEYQKVLYKDDSSIGDWNMNFLSIAVSNDGGFIYISNMYNNLITIDISGNYLYTLQLKGLLLGRMALCVDDKGYVYVSANELVTCSIVQISADGRQNLGTLFQLKGQCNSISFDRDKSALIVTADSDKFKVLTLR